MRGLGPNTFLYLFSVLVILSVHTLLAQDTDAAPTTIDGDWTIGVDTLLSNGTWIVSGTIYVSECTLTLEDSTLILNSSSHLRNRVVVNSTAHLISRRSTIAGGARGVCIEVRGDSLLENTTVRNMDRAYREFGLFHEGGRLVLFDCMFEDGLNLIYSTSDLVVRSCGFSGFDGDAIRWTFIEDRGSKSLLVENSTFDNSVVSGRGMYLTGSYSLQPGWNAIIRRCNFENLGTCILAEGCEEQGSLEIESSDAIRCDNALVLFYVGSTTYIHDNDWHLTSDGVGHNIQLRGDASPKVSNETIVGGKTGMVIYGQYQGLVLRNINLSGAVGHALDVYLVYLRVYDSHLRNLGANIILRGPTFVHLIGCDTEHSGVVQGDGEILELVGIQVTSVSWGMGTPILEGVVTFETVDEFQVLSWNISRPPDLEFPIRIIKRSQNWFVDRARASYDQGGLTFHSDLFQVSSAGQLDLVILDNVAPELVVERPAEGARVRVSELVVSGRIVERGEGMGTVRVRLEGGTWEEAQLLPDGSWRHTLSDVADGDVNVTVNATDLSGNSVEVRVAGIILDTVPPPIDVLLPPSQVRTTPVELVVRTEVGSEATVNHRPVEVGYDGMFSTLLALYEGGNEVLVSVEDRGGNVNQTTFLVVLDTVSPTLAVTSPGEGDWTRAEVVWVNGTTEPGAEVRVNGNLVEADGGEFSTEISLPEGDATIHVMATDGAGNVARLLRTIHVDRTAPLLEIIEPIDGSITNERILLVLGNATDDSPIVVLVLGIPVPMVGGQWFDQLVLLEGLNEIEIKALDSAGNMAIDTVVVVLDLRPPSLGITLEIGGRTFGPGQGTLFTMDTQAVFTLETDEDVTVIVVDRTTFMVQSGRTDRTFLLREGSNTFSFTAMDRAGNAWGPVDFHINSDTITPDLVIHSPESGMVTHRPIVRVVGMTEPGARVSIDGSIPIVYLNGSFEALVNLDIGSNSIIIMATDAANNSAVESVQVIRMEQEDVTSTDKDSAWLEMVLSMSAVFAIAVAILWVVKHRKTSSEWIDSGPHEVASGGGEGSPGASSQKDKEG